MSKFYEERVLSVHHWTDNLFSFRTTRDPAFRFRNGEFTMIGLEVEGRPLLRAYSVVSANYEEELEFFSIKVQDGPLTSKLQHLKVGDPIIVGKKPTGTLVLDNLLPGRNLYLLGTGTGLAPFLSIIKDPEAYDRFEKVVLVHGCRQVQELAYGETITETLPPQRGPPVPGRTAPEPAPAPRRRRAVRRRSAPPRSRRAWGDGSREDSGVRGTARPSPTTRIAACRWEYPCAAAAAAGSAASPRRPRT
ncbi:ferredoxin--NADP reductase [Methylobacterium fujisawaense]|uniref:ferredoxin--NADP reductase n=1 Tax=Methylobacterium fujisawaense TaxID=107400 RepID=UPI002F34F21D